MSLLKEDSCKEIANFNLEAVIFIMVKSLDKRSWNQKRACSQTPMSVIKVLQLYEVWETPKTSNLVTSCISSWNTNLICCSVCPEWDLILIIFCLESFVYFTVFSYICTDDVTCEKQGPDCANPTHQTNIQTPGERGLLRIEWHNTRVQSRMLQHQESGTFSENSQLSDTPASNVYVCITPAIAC